jgi:hypothetical protein
VIVYKAKQSLLLVLGKLLVRPLVMGKQQLCCALRKVL